MSYEVHSQVWGKSERNQIKIADSAANVDSYSFKGSIIILNGNIKK